MFKSIVLLFLTLAVVKAQNNALDSSIKPHSNSSKCSSGVENYINLNKMQFAYNLKDVNTQIETFKQIYDFRLNTIEIQLDMMVDGLLLNEERLNPLAALSDLSQECISKYRPMIPTIESTKNSTEFCILTAKNEMDAMLKYPWAYRDQIDNSYGYFDSIINGCNYEFVNATTLDNYTQCVADGVFYTNTVANRERMAFAAEMNTAYCTADTNIKTALDCSFSIQNQTIALTAEANSLINRCLSGLDNCANSGQGYYCPNAYTIPKSELNQTTIANPLYGRNETLDCLMMEIN